MKRLILLVFIICYSAFGMSEEQPKKLYLRIIVEDEDRDFLESLYTQIIDVHRGCKERYMRECYVTAATAEKWANEYVSRDTHSQEGHMQGYVGDQGFLEKIKNMLMSQYGFFVMYHYKEKLYERIGLSNVPFFLGGAAYLDDCEKKAETSSILDVFKELPFYYEEESDIAEAITTKNFSCNPIGALDQKSVSQSIRSAYHLLVPEDLLHEDEAVSSCTSITTRRLSTLAPSPLCLPVKNKGEYQIILIPQ